MITDISIDVDVHRRGDVGMKMGEEEKSRKLVVIYAFLDSLFTVQLQ